MTDTDLMLLLVEAMFLMPGKLHVLRKDTTNEHHSIKTELSFSFMKSLMMIMGYQPRKWQACRWDRCFEKNRYEAFKTRLPVMANAPATEIDAVFGTTHDDRLQGRFSKHPARARTDTTHQSR
jgi:hypothetical protein